MRHGWTRGSWSGGRRLPHGLPSILLRPSVLPLLLALSLAACGDGGPLLFPAPASLVPGDQVPEGRVGEELVPAPEVQLRDARGNPAPGVEVTFVPLEGSGRIPTAVVRTDARGVARAQGWVLGEATGIQRLRVQAPGLPELVLDVRALPGPPARLDPLGGAVEFTGRVGEEVEASLGVRVTDRFGNPVTGRVVNFETPHGGSLSPASAVSDDAGAARLERWVLGPGAGVQTLRAFVGDLAQAEFTARALPGPPAELAPAGRPLPSGVVGLPLDTVPAVRILDRFGNPVPGRAVEFRTAPSHGSVSPSHAVSDSLGEAAPGRWTLGPVAGIQVLEAVVPPLPPLRLEALARAGDPVVLEPGSPLDQEAFVDSIVPHRPTVRVLDRFGNPVEGVPAEFQVVGGGGRITGSPGLSRADGFAWAQAWHLGPEPGENRVEARVQGIDQAVVFRATGLEVPRFDLIVDGVQLNQGSQRLTGGIAPVAGRPGVLRVVVRATTPTDVSPPVRIRLRAGGQLLREETVFRSGTGVPVDPDLTVGSQSWNLPLRSHEIRPDLEVQVEVDPEGVVEVDRRDTNRFPRNGSFTSLGVVADSDFRIRLIPVHQSATNLVGRVDEGNAGSFVDASWRLLPVPGIQWEVRLPYTTDAPALEPTNENGAWSQVLSEIQALRVAEGATDEYYYGVVQWPFSGGGIAGIGYILPHPSHPARSALGFDEPQGRSVIMAHELGHTLGRRHAPCGGAGGVDPAYPYAGGRIGVAGWDVATDRFISPAGEARDLMGYCSPVWISDYTFGAIRNWRRDDPLATAPAWAAASSTEGLLVWGRIDSRGPVLEPAFRLPGRILEPEGAGPHRLSLLDEEGRVLYRRSFPGTPVEHARDPEERHFAFLLPLDDTALSRGTVLRLETPFGTVERRMPPAGAPGVEETAPSLVAGADRAELTWDSARFPMALVRDRTTGTILALGRTGRIGVPLPAGGDPRDLRILLSHGVGSVEVEPR
jgi:predicted small lipoprotein YifL